jgi:hypothetical protein
MNLDIQVYNSKLNETDKNISDVLADHISSSLPDAENKIWHGHPVWFIDGNPIVGYSKQKNGIRLLFWSGQSFDEEKLQKEGNFKAAEINFREVKQINKKDLTRWLNKAKQIQWDYKNIVKRKGVLERLK